MSRKAFRIYDLWKLSYIQCQSKWAFHVWTKITSSMFSDPPSTISLPSSATCSIGCICDRILFCKYLSHDWFLFRKYQNSSLTVLPKMCSSCSWSWLHSSFLNSPVIHLNALFSDADLNLSWNSILIMFYHFSLQINRFSVIHHPLTG